MLSKKFGGLILGFGLVLVIILVVVIRQEGSETPASQSNSTSETRTKSSAQSNQAPKDQNNNQAEGVEPTRVVPNQVFMAKDQAYDAIDKKDDVQTYFSVTVKTNDQGQVLKCETIPKTDIFNKQELDLIKTDDQEISQYLVLYNRSHRYGTDDMESTSTVLSINEFVNNILDEKLKEDHPGKKDDYKPLIAKLLRVQHMLDGSDASGILEALDTTKQCSFHLKIAKPANSAPIGVQACSLEEAGLVFASHLTPKAYIGSYHSFPAYPSQSDFKGNLEMLDPKEDKKSCQKSVFEIPDNHVGFDDLVYFLIYKEAKAESVNLVFGDPTEGAPRLFLDLPAWSD